MDGFFPYIPQMITTMRRCTVLNDLGPGPISSKSFSYDSAIKLLKYGTPCRLHCTACTDLDGFFLYFPNSILGRGGGGGYLNIAFIACCIQIFLDGPFNYLLLSYFSYALYHSHCFLPSCDSCLFYFYLHIYIYNLCSCFCCNVLNELCAWTGCTWAASDVSNWCVMCL